MPRLSLFWRTFLLIVALIILSVMSALQAVRVFDRSPPARQLAWELASVVNLTRSALVNSRGEMRGMLLAELAAEEGVHVLPAEPHDQVEDLRHSVPEATELAVAAQIELASVLGRSTRLAGRVNGDAALWVGFDIDGDDYWLRLDRQRFERQRGPNWTLIGLIVLGLAGIGALGISQLVNRPLARLAQAISNIGAGRAAGTLPEAGPSEIAALNRSFNRMASDLARIESDRELTLAGISHDIRTPLARMRLEIEMSALDAQVRDSLVEDIQSIDRIVGQFVEFGRSAGRTAEGPAASRVTLVRISDAVADLAAAHRGAIAAGMLRLHTRITPDDLSWLGDPMDLRRLLGNLAGNALKYGRSPGQERVEVTITAIRRVSGVAIEFDDSGPGVPEGDREWLLRPFARRDTARGGDGGSGLGLAIVARIAARYRGHCSLGQSPTGGLRVSILLNDHPTGPSASTPTDFRRG